MTLFGIHISRDINLGDVLVGFAPILAIAINILVFRGYRRRAPIRLSDADVKLIKNERAKFSAAWANTIATGFLAAGFFPAIAALVKVAEGSGQPDWQFVLTGLTLTPFAFALHIVGRFLLRGLRA